MRLRYCEQCKEDFHRMDLGYNARGEDCGNWHCHLFDRLNLFVAFLIIIPVLIILSPLFLVLIITNKLNLNGL